jgi:hypothetical protein
MQHSLKTSKTPSNKPGTRYEVPIKWGETVSTNKWIDALAYANEHFGLTGDLLRTHPKTEFVIFSFEREADAIIFALKFT